MDVQQTTSLLTDYRFWTSIVSLLFSGVAVWPKFKSWVTRGKLVVNTGTQIALCHNIGSSCVQLYISLSNESPRNVKIESITLSIKGDNEKTKELPCWVIYQKQDSNLQSLFVPFILKSDTEWTHNIQFVDLRNIGDENKFRRAAHEISKDLENKLLINQLITINPEASESVKNSFPSPVPEVDDKLLAPILEIFSSKYFWESQGYEASLKIKLADSNKVFEKNFAFSLFDTDIVEMKRHMKFYKNGNGIVYPINQNQWVHIPWKSAS